MSYQRFSTDDVAMLREELVLHSMDSWQAGERLEMFLVEHGFGVSKPEAQRAARRIGARGYSLKRVREELEKLALVM